MFSYSSRYSNVTSASRDFFEVFLYCFMCLLIFLPHWGNYVILWQLGKEIKVCSVIDHGTFRSLVQVQIFLRCFLYYLFVFLNFSAILENLRYILHFWAFTKTSKFCYVILHETLRSLVQIANLGIFFCCLCVFLDLWFIFEWLRKEVSFFYPIGHDILRSLAQLKKIWGVFILYMLVSLIVWSFWAFT